MPWSEAPPTLRSSLNSLGAGSARSFPALREALEGRFEPHHALVIRTGHLASWAGRCPGNHQSAGKRRSGQSRKGSKWLGIALEEAALAATRTKGSYLQAQYQRLRPRIGHGRALGAVKHSILVAYWHMFSTGETYRELGGDYYQRRDPERLTRRLVAQLEQLGHHVTLEVAAA